MRSTSKSRATHFQRKDRLPTAPALAAFVALAALLVASSGCSGKNASAHPNAAAPAGDKNSDHDASVSAENVIAVSTIHPKRNPQFGRAVTQPAFVEGFYKAELMAHVAGTVKDIQKNIGDTIQKGEVLVELDAPDLEQDLLQKTALVQQAQQDHRAAEANVGVVEAMAVTAQSLVKQREAGENRSAAMKRFHEQEYARYKTLAESNAIVGNVLDEKRRDLEAMNADYQAAQAATETAQAGAEEFSAKLAAARVDVEVKRARVAVAEADRARAQAMLDYAKIRAPFDGLIVDRQVDPGSFVQNASTGHPTPMLRVVRVDVVTVVAWIPEKDAPLIKPDTEAAIHLDALGSREIHTKISRYSHWLDPEKSRDMRVEADLDNKDGLLTPGMYGSMKLLLQNFGQARLVPASAVFASGSQTYIFEVRDGRAVRVPVRVELEDGVQAKIVKVSQSKKPGSETHAETYQELTDQDEIVRSGQGELADGQPVKAVATDW